MPDRAFPPHLMTWCMAKRLRFAATRLFPAGLLLAGLLGTGCGEKPSDSKTRPPVTILNDGGETKMLVDLRRMGGASVLRSIRGQNDLDDLDYTQARAKPTPLRLPEAAPGIDAVLLFKPGEIYDPENPAMVEKMRLAFGPKQPVALRLQAVQWAAYRRDGRFLDNIAGEMKSGSLIAADAARALAQFADALPADRARARDALCGVLSDTDYYLSAAAAKALAQIGDGAAVPALRSQFEREKVEYNRVLLCHALGYLVLHAEPPVSPSERLRVQEALRKPLNDIKEDPLVRAEAAVALVATGDKTALAFLKALADTAVSPEMQYLGIEGLVLAGAEEAQIYVLAALDSDLPVVWSGAIQLCALLPADEIVPALEHSLHEAVTERQAARTVLALGFLEQDSALKWLPYVAENGETQERRLALEVLGGYGRVEYAESCARWLDDPSPGVRESAAQALLNMNATSYAARVADAARYGNPYTRWVMTEVAAQLAANAEAAALEPTLQGGGPPAIRPARNTGARPARELDQALVELQRQTLSKLRLVGWSTASGRPVAAVFRDGDGKERTSLPGEYVSGAFVLTGMELEEESPPPPANGSPPGAPPAAAGAQPKQVVVAWLDDGNVLAKFRPNEAPQLSNMAKAGTPGAPTTP